MSILIDPLTFTGDDRVHDPSRIVEDRGAYYFFSTGPGVRSWTSVDGSVWSSAGSVFEAVPAWARTLVPRKTDQSLWAPDIIRCGDRFCLYYSISTWGSNESAIGLATTERLDGGQWTDEGCVIASGATTTYNAIDPCPIFDESGRLWLCFGSFFSGIHLVALDGSTGLVNDRDRNVLLLAARPDVPNNPIEAASIYRRGCDYYLLTSWDYCCKGVDSTYHIRAGRSSTIDGPYVDRDGVDLRAGGGDLVLGAIGNRLGPGQPNIFTLDGSEFLTYHYYDALDGGKPKFGLAAVDWTVDGWPIVTG